MIAGEGVHRAARDRDPGLQAQGVCRGASQVAHDRARLARLWKPVRRDPGARDRRAIGDELVRGQRRDRRAGQPECQPLPGREVPARGIGGGAVVALDPQGGRQPRQGPATDAGRGGQLIGFGDGPGVQPGDRRSGRLAATVDGDQRRAVTIDPDRDHLGKIVDVQGANRRHDGRPPGPGILLGPAVVPRIDARSRTGRSPAGARPA